MNYADTIDALADEVEHASPFNPEACAGRLRALSATIRQRERETIWPTNEEEQAAFEKWLCGMTNTPPDAEIDRRDHTYLWALAAWRYRGGLVTPPAADDAVLKDAARLRNMLTDKVTFYLERYRQDGSSYNEGALDGAEVMLQITAFALAQRTAATENKT